MAYQGTTAASSVSNPPINLVRGMAPTLNASGNLLYSTASSSPSVVQGGNGIWHYMSTDPTTTIVGTLNYFTDGLQLGMRNGDVIYCVSVSSAGSTSSLLMGIGVLATTNSTAGFSVGTGSLMLSTQ